MSAPVLAERSRCTGCGACAAGCPKNAITMVSDREGFFYPVVGDSCVQCGQCESNCPQHLPIIQYLQEIHEECCGK